MFIEAKLFNSTTQADCAVFYKRILRSIKHVLSDELSDGACFIFTGNFGDELTSAKNLKKNYPFCLELHLNKQRKRYAGHDH